MEENLQHPDTLFLSNPNKFSHQSFFRDRNWKLVESFWCSLIKTKNLPSWVHGSENYGTADLQAVHNCALDELNNPRNKRKTYAVKLGYAGTSYQVCFEATIMLWLVFVM